MRNLTVRASLLAALFNTHIASAQDVELRIGYLRGPSDLSLLRENGELDRALAKQGVKVTWLGPFPAAAPAYEALNGGSLDMTSGSSTAFVTAIAGGTPMVMFGYQPMPAGGEGIVVHNDSSIRTVSDLKGKTVAANRGGTGEYLLSRALQTAGVDEKAVTKQYLTPTDSGSAFSSGHIDAWATWDPYLSIAVKNYNGRILVNGKELGSENAAGYFISRQFITDHPAVVRSVFDVLKSTNAWARQHPQEAGRVWAKQMGNQNEEVARQLGETNTSELIAVGPDQAKHIENVAAWYAEKKIIRSKPDVKSSLIDFSQ